tara:strand:+ start:8 stop:682 length:675 start_codon:yes stop_codon:yes gene_type:complete
MPCLQEKNKISNHYINIMTRTKKKRNYKKAPRNTRVFRCVQKVKKKHKIGDAIAICQSSTKQGYRTGKKLTLKGKKTRKKRGGDKSKKVKRLIKIFQQYPEIFPSGYFRFLGARLQNHIDKKTLWNKKGVILTWIKYKKTVKKTPKCVIKPGDVKLDQIVNKNQGNGAAKKITLQFLKKFEKDRIWLEVRANNKRAIKFYKKNGFKKVCNIKFGDMLGIMMVKN